MDRISQIKNELLMKEWAAMVRKCRSSGLTVKNWCMNNGVNIKTYYYRLKRVRNFICDLNPESSTDNSALALQRDIVPVPMDAMSNDNIRQIRITTANISVELPASVQPQLLKAAIEGLKC